MGKIFLILLCSQIFFWYKIHHIKPDLHIVPEVPTKLAVKAFSFGDEELYFRILAMELQNAGDSFGRFTALKLYDYTKLAKWFYLLDSLDSQSNFVPSIAAYYYSQTQRTEDVIYIINYLDYHASKNLREKWWWMAQAAHLANFKLKDQQLALKLAYKLSNTPSKIPMWARQMPAFIHEKLGEKDQSYKIIKNILDNEQDLTPHEMNFILYFIKDRLGKELDNLEK